MSGFRTDDGLLSSESDTINIGNDMLFPDPEKLKEEKKEQGSNTVQQMEKSDKADFRFSELLDPTHLAEMGAVAIGSWFLTRNAWLTAGITAGYHYVRHT